MAVPTVYLDNSATTPVDPRVAAVMARAVVETFGNASSVHGFGQQARAAVDRARREVAALIGAKQNEIVFTSGGTEANNLAIRGLCEASAAHGRHIIISAIEHPSVAGTCLELKKRGWEVTRLPVYKNGIVRVEDLEQAIRADTVLITIMLANNEIGTIQPVREIGAFVKERRAAGHKNLWCHTDAVQAAGRLALNVDELGCDLLTISAHKIYAPKGTGALYVRRGVRLQGQNVGGHQERERRAGTENVPGIVAFGEAARLARDELAERSAHDRELRDRFEAAVQSRIPNVVMNGDREQRLGHVSNISFRFIEGEGLLINLDLEGVAVSTGSACSSGTLEPSPVIRALGVDDELARGSIRFSFGKDNTEDELDYAVEVLVKAVERLRALSPLTSVNHGELPEANAIADEENPVCGDRIRLSLMIADERIENAGYMAYGCPPTLVCGSALTEMIKGKLITEAQQLTRADLLNAVGGLPSRKHHAAALAIETLNSALQNYKTGLQDENAFTCKS
ncbi:MAG TPA: IscS subfamily cysteine desulfurase [Pyrinomonadaceae bacterium]|nr:IscS subfamily cysteine desulfurase [Pyrinomonadaceae bacterium]